MLKPFTFIYSIILLFQETYTTDYCKLCENHSHTMCKYTKAGPSESCINYTTLKMVPKIRTTIVGLHNKIRNKVASGKETRGIDGPQPSASNMLLLKWDNELAMIAQRWADQCILITDPNQHDECKTVDRFDVGQNIMILQSGRLHSFVDIIETMLEQWHKEVEFVYPKLIDAFVSTKNPQNETGYYTQLVWANTQYVGCAYVAYVTLVSSKNIVVNKFICNYGPTGNILGASVYKKGKPCSDCNCNSAFAALCDDDGSILQSNAMESLENEPNQKKITYSHVKRQALPIENKASLSRISESTDGSEFNKRSYSYVQLPDKLFDLFETAKKYNQGSNDELMKDLSALYNKYYANNSSSLKNVDSVSIGTSIATPHFNHTLDDVNNVDDEIQFRQDLQTNATPPVSKAEISKTPATVPITDSSVANKSIEKTTDTTAQTTTNKKYTMTDPKTETTTKIKEETTSDTQQATSTEMSTRVTTVIETTTERKIQNISTTTKSKKFKETTSDTEENTTTEITARVITAVESTKKKETQNNYITTKSKSKDDLNNTKSDTTTEHLDTTATPQDKTETLEQTVTLNTERVHADHTLNKNCPLQDAALRYKFLHGDGDECYCLYRIMNCANKAATNLYLILNVFIVIFYCYTRS